MKLENEFTVPAPIDQAWAVLLDVPRVAPCLPGAAVEEGGGEDGEYKGTMTIKIGPITARYAGTVKIQDSDVAAHRVAMRAQAKDARGQGTAAATITSTMQETPEGTKVNVVTDMRVTGPAAQFGRGVMQDVSAKLMRQFAECLASEMNAAPAAPADVPAAAEAAAPGAAGTPAASDAAGTPAASDAAGKPAVESDAAATPAASDAAGTPAASDAAGKPAVESDAAATSAASDAAGTSPASDATGTPAASDATAGPAASDAAEAPPAPAAPAWKPPPPRPTPDVLDLGEASRDAILKRAIPLVAGAAALLILLRLIRR